MHDQPSTRLGRGLIAMLVVVGLAATVMAYLVTSRILDRRTTAAPAGPDNPAATSPEGSATGSPTPQAPDPSTSPAPASPPPSLGPDRSAPGDGESCPEPTREAVAAAGLNDQLTLRIYVEFTVPRGAARAWVCENGDGVLIYQAHERRGPFDLAFNTRNTLLLAAGIRGEVAATADGFRAVNQDSQGAITEYLVTNTVVTITSPSGNVINAPVTFVYLPG